MKKSTFKSGNTLTAAAVEFNNMVFPIEIIIAAKNKKQLREALDSMHIEYDSCKFVRIAVTPNTSDQGRSETKSLASDCSDLPKIGKQCKL